MVEHLSIESHHLKTVNQLIPYAINDGTIFGNDALHCLRRPSILEFIPPGPRSGTRELAPPCILASFTYASDVLDTAHSHMPQSTILSKVELQRKAPKLHPTFDTLSSKKTSLAPNNDLSVSRTALGR